VDVIYLTLLSGALLAIVASVVSAVRAVSRPPVWTRDVVPRTSFDSAPPPVQAAAVPTVAGAASAVDASRPSLAEPVAMRDGPAALPSGKAAEGERELLAA
jgi:hypothetical protein